ncbi:hypothetical protein [Nocardioides sp.]|uniref:hypothetical protein n=1 Tax=Nocardioides sp. TaxID=35761 RepID=UPI002CCBBB2A|nr:hypothetical protein [Nocardioides sp.]HXH79570.1 hypothetical protein [Nocardioides sp.]
MHRPNRLRTAAFAVLLATLLSGCGATNGAPAETAPVAEAADTTTPTAATTPSGKASTTSPAPPPCKSPSEVPEAQDSEVLVYFTCAAGMEGDFHSFARPVRASDSVEERLNAAVEAYLSGPLPGEGQNYFTFAGKDALNSTDVIGPRAIIDINFDGVGMSTSAQSGHIWNVLELLAFQFPAISEMEPRWNGSCEAFGAAVQAGECLIARRNGDYVPGA